MKKVIIIIFFIPLILFSVNQIMIKPSIIPSMFDFSMSNIIYSDINNPGVSFLNKTYSYIGSWDVRIPSSNPFGVLKHYYRYTSPMFTWSDDKKNIITRVDDSNPTGAGYPVIIDQNNKIEFCPESKSVFGYHRAWLKNDKSLITNTKINNKDAVVRFDMENCEIIDTLYEGGDLEAIEEADISSEGWLIISRHSMDKNTDEIIISDSNGSIYDIFPGVYPSFSKDEKSIVYTDYDKGIYLYQINSKTKGLIAESGVWSDSIATLSEDGKIVFYNGVIDGRNKIIMVDIDTSLLKQIADGLYPNYR